MRPDDKIPVRVAIGGRVLPLKVTRQDEEFVRMAARMLNKRMEEFKQFHAGDDTDRLTWAALDFTGDLLRLRTEHQASDDGTAQELQTLEELLQGY